MEDKFATELLHEVKQNAHRWFVAFCIMVVLEFLTIVGFMWYISLPTDSTETTQTIEDITDGDITQIGGDYGESDTNNP